jgi:two-component system chemotaxis sensor kinase CheA
VRVPGARLDELLAASGQLLVTDSRMRARPAELEAFHEQVTRRAAEWGPVSRQLRLALERSGASPGLIATVNRMSDDLRRLAQEAGRLAANISADARALSQVTDDVAARVRRLRMRPFSEACEMLPRVVRDVAAATGKDVDLTLSGVDVEVDRAVLDGLREALLHLVRNAVDHGIEAPGVRKGAGKPARGVVTVGAALRGERVHVTVADDGAGLDLGAVRARLARGGQSAPAEDRDLIRAMLQGGVSTRAEVTAISGRGVGLDAARAAIERLRGSLDVSWATGQGTTFTLECPPTLTTIRALLVAVGPQMLAIPTSQVERVARIALQDVKRAEGRDVIATAAAPVPLVALGRLLPPLSEQPPDGPRPVVLLRAGERRLAVAVDQLVAEQELVLRPIGRGRRLPHVSGAALLGTGRVALVLNPLTTVAAGLALGAAAPSPAERQPAAPARSRILVVDDSITTRALEQSLLEAAGYEVLTAVDGADGWQQLQDRGVDLVVADVEMPRMDGFALCAAIRGSRRFKALPVVLVTALESPEHRTQGLEAGADAYLGKSSFDQQGLLDVIAQLLGRP